MKRSTSIVPPESQTGAVVVALKRVVCPPHGLHVFKGRPTVTVHILLCTAEPHSNALGGGRRFCTCTKTEGQIDWPLLPTTPNALSYMTGRVGRSVIESVTFGCDRSLHQSALHAGEWRISGPEV